MRWLPVFLSAAVLLGAGVYFDSARTPFEGEASYLAAVKDEINAVPYRIGGWLGQDEQVSEAARDLLQSNEILQRRYVQPGSGLPGWSLLISHCGIEDDMLGHYPPVCYPAHGWLHRESELEDFVWRGGGLEIPARRYTIERTSGIGSERVYVYNFFVQPTEVGYFAASMEGVGSSAASLSRYEAGVAQVQVLMGEEMPEAEREAILRDVLVAIRGVIERIREGSA